MKGKEEPVKTKKATQETSSPSQKPDGDAPSAAERAQAFIKMMNTSPRYRGKVQVRSAKDYRTPYYLRRPTGVLSLDIALGGGFPAGGASQVFGARSSGKTHMCFKVAGQIQKNYGDNAIIALGLSELRADVGFARMSGFCIEYSDQQVKEYEDIRISKGQPKFTAEERADLKKQIGQVIFLQGSTGGDMLDGTLELIDNVGSACQLIIVDSLGSLLTNDQDDKSVSDKHYGGSSGIITLWQTKMQPKYINDLPDGSVLETTILGINQVRALIGGPIPGATRPAAGSKAWEHAQLTSVEFKQGEPLWKDSKHTEQSGRIVKWNIKKGKAGTHDGAKGEFSWYHFPEHDPVFWKDVLAHGPSYGADTITDLVDTAKHLGVIEMGGAWRTFKDVEGKMIFRAQGDDSVVEKVVNDPELENLLRDHCNLKTNLTVRYR